MSAEHQVCQHIRSDSDNRLYSVPSTFQTFQISYSSKKKTFIFFLQREKVKERKWSRLSGGNDTFPLSLFFFHSVHRICNLKGHSTGPVHISLCLERRTRARKRRQGWHGGGGMHFSLSRLISPSDSSQQIRPRRCHIIMSSLRTVPRSCVRPLSCKSEPNDRLFARKWTACLLPSL